MIVDTLKKPADRYHHITTSVRCQARICRSAYICISFSMRLSTS